MRKIVMEKMGMERGSRYKKYTGELMVVLIIIVVV